ncbi:MAG: transposase [Desulfitobacteriaceae bacterium]|nr:transposase [Desulfitobacteriaceae bacterium]
MARVSREKSSTGIYHIMLRGIDKRDVFIDDKDREVFINYLSSAKEKSNYVIYGYCLMDNHIHLLIEEGHEHIGESIKRITVGYVQWHNLKYSRTGHLFQNRYKSEVIEDDAYFLTVLRYIHQNPIKAGIVQDIADYKWSSYIYYLEGPEQRLVSVDRGKSYFVSQNNFTDFMKMPSSDQCLEYEVKIKYTDEKLKNEILKVYTKSELIASLPKEERNKVIKEIKQYTGASNRQLSRVLGIGRGIVERIY